MGIKVSRRIWEGINKFLVGFGSLLGLFGVRISSGEIILPQIDNFGSSVDDLFHLELNKEGRVVFDSTFS